MNNQELQDTRSLLETGLSAKNRDRMRSDLMTLYTLLQEQVKSCSSADYKNLLDCITSKLTEMFSNVSSSHDHSRGLHAIVCIICCEGALFNDLKGAIHHHLLWMIRESSEQSLSELLAVVIGQYVAAHGLLYSERVDKMVNELLERVGKERSETKRITSIRALKEIGARSPGILFRFNEDCIRAVSPLLQDTRIAIREEAAILLRSVIWTTNSREFGHEVDDGRNHPAMKYYNYLLQQIHVEIKKSSLKVIKHHPKDEILHGSILTARELYRAAVICQVKDPKLLETFLMLENRSFEDESPVVCSYTELHAARRRRVSGSLLSQTVTPLTMLDPRRVDEFRPPFSCVNELRAIFKLMCENVTLVLKGGHKNMASIPACLDLLPWLSAFDSKQFSEVINLQQLVDDILPLTKREKLLSKHILTLALLCYTMPKKMKPYLKQVVLAISIELSIRESSVTRRSETVNVIVSLAIGILADSFKEDVASEVKNILIPISKAGFNQSLTDCLEKVVKSIPSLRKAVCGILHNHISFIVNQQAAAISSSQVSSGKASTASSTAGYFQAFQHSLFLSVYSTGEVSGCDADMNALLSALRNLGRFDFQGFNMIAILKTLCEKLIYSDHKRIRVEAIKAICMVLLPLTRDVTYCAVHGTTNQDYAMIASYLRNIVQIAVSDEEPDVRYTAISVLDDNPGLNYFIAQSENLHILFFAVHDEIFEIREVAISLIGQLCNINPAYVLSPLRQFLLELIHQLEMGEGITQREQAIRSIAGLVASAPRFMCGFTHAMISALLTSLHASNGKTTSLLVPTVQAIGEFAQIASGETLVWMDDVFPILLRMLNRDTTSEYKEVALWSMARLIQSSGYVQEPIVRHPELYPVLLELVRFYPSEFVNHEALRVLGVLGALDPFKYDRLRADKKPTVVHNEYTSEKDSHRRKDSIEGMGWAQTSREAMNELPSVAKSGEGLYFAIALKELGAILQNQSLKFIHARTVNTISQICGQVDVEIASSFIGQVISEMLALIRLTNPEDMARFIDNLADLLSNAGERTRYFLDDITELIQNVWTDRHDIVLAIVKLISSVKYDAKDEFKIYAIRLLPLLLKALKFRGRQPEHDDRVIEKVLVLLGNLCPLIKLQVQIVVPAVIETITDNKLSLSTRTAGVQTLSELVHQLDLSKFASGIILPLVRVASAVPDLYKNVLDAILMLGHRMRKDILIYRHPLLTVFGKETSLEQLFIDVEGDDRLIMSSWTSRCTYGYSSSKTIRAESKPEHSASISKGVDRRTSGSNFGYSVNLLIKIWDMVDQVCREDVTDWFQTFCLSFLKESPSPTLQTCHDNLFDSYSSIASSLFAVSFMSCWQYLGVGERDKLIVCISQILKRFDSVDIGRQILDLVEFFDHYSTTGPLPVDLDDLIKKAVQVRAYARALQYVERRFKQKDGCCAQVIESLISINNELDQQEAALGALAFARMQSMVIKELWYEKLGHWRRALRNYEFRQANEPHDTEILLGRLRCLKELGEWRQLQDICMDKLKSSDVHVEVKQSIASIATPCVWALGSWDFMSKLVNEYMDHGTVHGQIYSAVLSLRDKNLKEAKQAIGMAWNHLYPMCSALFSTDYARSHDILVQAQTLIELEEIIQYSLIPNRAPLVRKIWHKRLQESCHPDFDIWHRSLMVQSLVIPPIDNQKLWLALVDICSTYQKENQANYIFSNLLGTQSKVQIDSLPMEQPFLSFAILQHAWKSGDLNPNMKALIVSQMQNLIERLHSGPASSRRTMSSLLQSPLLAEEQKEIEDDRKRLVANCYHSCGLWDTDVHGIGEDTINRIQSYLQSAIDYQPAWGQAWRTMATFSYNVVLYYKQMLKANDANSRAYNEMLRHAVKCVESLFQCISLDHTDSLQSTLRLLTLWFQFGSNINVYQPISENLASVPVSTWLQVIPQLIARIDSKQPMIAKLVQQLLISIGRDHPQALIYPLAVTSKSDIPSRSQAAENVLASMRQHSKSLVQQALLISAELIRISILWEEQWYGAIDEASRLYFTESNIAGCMDILMPLHEMIEKGHETLKEKTFLDAYGTQLDAAQGNWKKYMQTGEQIEITKAWEIYYKVFKRLSMQLNDMTSLDMKFVSPKLQCCQDLELAVPGTYESGCLTNSEIVRIREVDPAVTVISSKQRPRKISILGSDGQRFTFLLKGHEDLRQDQRVMQLFGLVNSLLAADSQTSRRDLAIGRYSVVPLAPNNGLISWLQRCDTMHTLIRQYREENKIPLNLEHKIIQKECPEYDKIPLIGRVEIFERSLEKTCGDDLANILWQKSLSAEVWFNRRTNYVRSLAVMSIVGYVLGLGDRHPSNLMLDRTSGKVIHIDFGDCFEVAMKRKKFPETIPFRLTRMLVNAMEVTGVDGTFRLTCEIVMRLLREHKDSIIAVLEAFVYDPLISWRISSDDGAVGGCGVSVVSDDHELNARELSSSQSSRRCSCSTAARRQSETREGPDLLNTQALSIIKRVRDKVTGTDFREEDADLALMDESGSQVKNAPLTPKEQVTRLMKQALSHENLCQCYVGWCPFW